MSKFTIENRHRARRTTGVDATIGARLRNARLNAGLSQSDLAEHLGVTFQQIQKYEKGGNRVSAATLKAASQLLEVSLDDFFDENVSDDSPVMKTPLASRSELRMIAGYRNASPAVRRAFLSLVEAVTNPNGHADDEL